jgi:hypothetical protein
MSQRQCQQPKTNIKGKCQISCKIIVLEVFPSREPVRLWREGVGVGYPE